MDLLIAAHGLEHELAVLTGNLQEIQRVAGPAAESWMD